MREVSGTRFKDKSVKVQKDILDEEQHRIYMLYKDAANKNNQIKILSELYGKSKKEIANFLFYIGFDDSNVRRYL